MSFWQDSSYPPEIPAMEVKNLPFTVDLRPIGLVLKCPHIYRGAYNTRTQIVGCILMHPTRLVAPYSAEKVGSAHPTARLDLVHQDAPYSAPVGAELTSQVIAPGEEATFESGSV